MSLCPRRALTTWTGSLSLRRSVALLCRRPWNVMRLTAAAVISGGSLRRGHQPRDHRVTSLSVVVDNQFAHVQAAEMKLIDLDDAEAGALDRQAADDQAAKGERADRDSSDRESADREAADTLGFDGLGADRLGADRCRRRTSRWLVFHVFLHLGSCTREPPDVHSIQIVPGDAAVSSRRGR